MGGDKSIEIQQPQAAPTTTEGIAEWVKNMPAVFAEQQRQAPLEAQQQLDLLRQYGLPLSQALQNIDKSLYPETAGLQENLAGIANKGINATEMPAWMRDNYQSDFNSQLGGNVNSGMGADYVSRGMQEQLYNQQQGYQNLGLSLAGRQPLTAAQSPQYTNYAAGFTPGAVMGQQAGAYNSYMPYAQNYANQQGMLSMMPSQSERAGQMWGSMLMGKS